MQTVLVVGLGEIGSTVLGILKENNKFKVYGLDLDKKKMEEIVADLGVNLRFITRNTYHTNAVLILKSRCLCIFTYLYE